MNDSDYTRAEKVMMFTLFVALTIILAVKWFDGSDGWLGWLSVLVIAVQVGIALRARRRFRRRKLIRTEGPAQI